MLACHECRILGVDHPGETQIGERVLVRAIDFGFLRKRRQFFQGMKELLTAAIKYSSAAAAEQGVATEQGISSIIRYVNSCVARYVEHIQRGFQLGKVNFVTLADCLMGEAEGFVARCVNRDILMTQERLDATDVVAMLVRDQNAAH